MKLEELKNKKILVVGVGVEGVAVFNYFKKHLPQNVIKVVDQKDGDNYLDCQKDFNIAIKSPGVKRELLKIPYTTATNIFLSNAKGKVIGVTGTKGKSTTSTLVYKMLKGQGFDAYLGGNIGEPSLDFLDKLNDQSWTVLEMSSFQLEDVKISPHIAVILMITAEHMDRYKEIDDYVDTKRNIIKFQTPSDFIVINRDYPASNESDIHTKGKVYFVSREREAKEGCFIRDGKIVLRIPARLMHAVRLARDAQIKSQNQSRSLNEIRQQPNSLSNVDLEPDFSCLTGDKSCIEGVVINTKDILLPGKHNLENICAAVMAASLAGVAKENMVKVLKTFKGLEHRLEFVSEKNGIKFYNDSLATIPEAAIEALETLPETETLIAGGFDRGLDFSNLGIKIVNSKVKTLILFPTTGEKIWQAVCKASKTNLPEKFEATSMDQAVGIASAETLPGSICLMSPASASFGLFKNYKDRGNQFKEEVQKIG
ncbi:MAG: UDP-N-acetylmuramoyl-L-alanine--D-glutamate ligase [bacterium]|nr:UDP-N-acetylmuramoyl-L-alanine--D-glutamate ligase [bacterium]